ncbi:hypothetical protein ACET3X_006798 [Alternaria dauci]|uniref:Uncharacterized protein n=1 Tax=Alternaria dauci TaxID=48095 RepID=A0ABR3UFJ5_9PLEO
MGPLNPCEPLTVEQEITGSHFAADHNTHCSATHSPPSLLYRALCPLLGPRCCHLRNDNIHLSACWSP